MSAARDPYVYPGTEVLINREDIRDARELKHFEVSMSAQRMREPMPAIGVTPQGYREVHRHIFQDVYAWAGQTRSVDMAKDRSLFCRASFIEPQMNERFAIIKFENALRGLNPPQFADRVAEHLAELNVIHPFREGNGRTMRAFLVEWGQQAGHLIDLQRIKPREWLEASRQSFLTADAKLMRDVVRTSIVSRDLQHERSIATDRDDYTRERGR